MNDEQYLQMAYKRTKEAFDGGGFPSGCIIVKDGKVLSEGASLGWEQHDPTGHADITAIRLACEKLGTIYLDGATMYSSVEPCLMCFSAASWARISKIVYSVKKNDLMIQKKYFEGKTNIEDINNQNIHKIELIHLPHNEQAINQLIKDEDSRQLDPQ